MYNPVLIFTWKVELFINFGKLPTLYRPLISKNISLDQVCDEIVRLGTQNIGKIVMKAEGQK